MPVTPHEGDRVRFKYNGTTMDGTITAFMYKSQKAVIDTKDGTKTVPIVDIIRKLS
jgi:hypothetical protein